MKVAVVFEENPAMGVDPRDPAKQPRRQGEFIDTERGVDVLLIWREYGDQFDGGSRTHVIPTGAWQHITNRQVKKILKRLGSLT